MIIRATTDIPADTELTIWYLLPSLERQPMDFSHWGFQCNCSMCTEIAATDPRILKKRLRLREEIAIALANSTDILGRQRVDTLIYRLTETYTQSPDGALQTALWEPLALLASACERQGEHKEAAEVVLRALESIGYVLEGAGVDASVAGPLLVKKWGLMMDGIVVAWLILRNALLEIAPERARQANQYARMAYLITVGEDTGFDAIYGRQAEDVQVEDPEE